MPSYLKMRQAEKRVLYARVEYYDWLQAWMVDKIPMGIQVGTYWSVSSLWNLVFNNR